MSYFARIASRGLGLPSAAPLAQPTLRTASPLAEFDQRLHPSLDPTPSADLPALGVLPARPEAPLAPAVEPGSEASAPPRVATPWQTPAVRLRAVGIRRELATSEPEPLTRPEAPQPELTAPRTRTALEPAPDPARVSSALARREVTAPEVESIRVVEPGPAHGRDIETASIPVPPARSLDPARPRPARLEPQERSEAARPDAPAAERRPVRAAEERRAPAAAQPETPLAALTQALARVNAWMQKPSAATAVEPVARASSERRAPSAASGPKLFIGHIDVEVVPPEPARRQIRTARATAAPRPAASTLAKQSFGTRQR